MYLPCISQARMGAERASLQRRAALGACGWLVSQQMRKGAAYKGVPEAR